MKPSRETWKLIQEGVEEARDHDRVRWERTKLIHAFARRVREFEVAEERPTDEQLREKVAGQWVNLVLNHSRRNKPPLRCTLPGVLVWLPEELVLIDGWYIPRGELLPDEQRYLANAAVDSLNSAKEKAEYEEALAASVEGWADIEERKGRQRHTMKQSIFMKEGGYVERVPEPESV